MYGKYVEYFGYTVWVWCCPDTPNSELQELAKARYATSVKAGLKGFWFTQSLKGAESIEYLLDEQRKCSA